MIKEAIKHLMELGIKPKDRVIEDPNWDRSLAVDNEGNVSIIPDAPVVVAKRELHLNTLTGLINYIKSNLDTKHNHYYLHIDNPKEVHLRGVLLSDGSRETLATTSPCLSGFSFDHFHDSETLIIALQSRFVKTQDREILLQVLGNAVEENVKNVGDDGVSQSINIRQGVASKAEVKVPNPVTLAPYRTFVEVSQPESKFIFRMKEGPRAAIFEADGGAWRNEAIQNIKMYLQEKLKEEIKDGRITILA